MNYAAILMSGLGLLILLLCLPLIYRKVPMNLFYGIRIPAAFKSDEHWYEINEYGGALMAKWSALIFAAGLVGFFLPDDSLHLYARIAPIIVCLGLGLPIFRTVRWAQSKY